MKIKIFTFIQNDRLNEGVVEAEINDFLKNVTVHSVQHVKGYDHIDSLDHFIILYEEKEAR